MEFVPQENELQRKSYTVLVALQLQPNVTSRPSRQLHGSNQGCPPTAVLPALLGGTRTELQHQ